MIREAVASENDVLGAFPLLLRDLTRRRIEAKRKVETTMGEERATWNALQGSFKILINSFYGYLGFGAGSFNDYQAAERVTLEGQKLIQEVVRHLRALEATPIEVDTDGVYFSPPDGVRTEEGEEAFIKRISDRLPEGINLAHDGRFRRMLSLKIKTYALLAHDGSVSLTGSALRSRSLERCFQVFMHDAARAFLEENQETVRSRYFELAEALQKRTLPVDEISQWTMLRQDRIGNRTRIKALLDRTPGRWRYGERVEIYERNDGTLAFATDYNDDENTLFLLRRLREVADRFRPLFPDDAEFEAAFPLIKPTSSIELARERKPTRQLRLM
jgi:DNA polymerase elongation subunit (family B)